MDIYSIRMLFCGQSQSAGHCAFVIAGDTQTGRKQLP